jgi:hypothetical protein
MPTIARFAHHIAFGTTVVAAILVFTAFVAFFRHDLGDPYVAAATFAGIGLVVWLSGRVALGWSRWRNRG